MQRLAVVIPTLDEAVRLPRLLADLTRLGDLASEVVVVDGGSSDDTIRVARAAGARVLEVAPGRGAQLAAGARATRSPWLLFVHADCRVTGPVERELRRFLDDAVEEDFAHFAFALDGRGLALRLIEVGQRVRERLGGLVYGDQGLVVSRTLYERVGGHPEWVLMEDVGIIDRLSRAGRRVRLDTELPTSSRRYAREGGIRAWLRNFVLLVRFRLGASPDLLARWYRPHQEPRNAEGAVVVFAKAPVAGRVKTRLAADLGDEEATRIYRAIGRETVDAVRTGPWATRVYVDPPGHDALTVVRRWLGPDGIVFHAQSPGSLGDRMVAAIRETLREYSAAVVVGTDIPGIGAGTVRQALTALEHSDVVLGPATDGGYYLIGLTEVRPGLFEGIPWSTPGVLESTMQAADRAGLRVTLLERKTDVDTLADVPPGYLGG